MARQTINIPITGDARPLRNALDDADGHLGRFQSGIGGKLTAIAGAIAGAFAVNAVINFGQEMLALGATIETANVKIDTVFGKQADVVREWADGVNESFGLTDTQVAGLAANMGDLLKPMGFTEDQAATMSRESLELAGALSAWSGGTRSVADVSEILTSAMLGEYETLKGLGISIDAAEVGTRALAIAQAEGATEVTAMHEALATQQLILEKSTDAQTAWNDGSMDAIKTQNELAARFAEVREEIATALYPWLIRLGEIIVTRIIPWIEGSLIPTLAKWWAWIDQKIVPAIALAWQWINGPFLEAISKMWSWVQERLIPMLANWWGVIVKNVIPALEDLVIAGQGVISRMFVGMTNWWYNGGGQRMWNAFVQALEYVVKLSEKIAGNSAASQILRTVLKGNPGFSWIPGLASGGPVTANSPYIVGEQGPELFVPGASGSIVPNHALGGGGNITVVVNALDPQAAGRAVVDAIRSYERSNGKGWRVAA